MFERIKSNPRKAIIVVISITAFFAFSIIWNGIKYEFNEESFLPHNKVTESNQWILKEFENYYYVVLLVKSQDGNILNKKDLVEILEMESVVNKSMHASATSIADLIATAFLLNKGEKINYENKIEILSKKSNKEIQQFLQFINKLAFTNYFSFFLSKDFDGYKANATIVQFALNGSLIFDKKTAFEKEREIQKIIESLPHSHVEASVLGGEIITNKIMKANKESILILLPISFLLVIIILYMTYRNEFEVLLSLIVLAMTIIWMYGFASILGFRLNPVSASIPVLLVGIGIDYSIHFIMRIKKGKNTNVVFSALILSTITTAIGFSSNAISSIPLLKQFGILSSFGILSCFAITMLFIPSINEIKPFKKINGNRIVVKGIYKIIGRAIKYKKTAILIIVAITILFSIFSLKLTSSYDIKDFLPENVKIARDTRYFISNFNFSTGEVDVLIKGNVTLPNLLKKIKESIDNMADDNYIIKKGKNADVESIISLMEDYATNNSIFDLRYNKTFSKMYYSIMEDGIPKENATYHDILSLYEWIYRHGGKYILHKDFSYDATILRIKVFPHGNKKAIKELYEEIKNDVTIKNCTITGSTITAYVVMENLQKSQIESAILAILFSFLAMDLIFLKKYSSATIALLAIIPVGIASIWILGTMAILGISLTVTTITVASISIGLGIDYSIHLVNEYMHEENVGQAVRNVAAAILSSALTTISAFALLSLSLLPPIRTFGIMISVAIVYAFISNIFVLPILLSIKN